MILVISDPKTGIAYPSKVEAAEIFMGKKIGEEVDLSTAGLPGYSAKITGGSDKDGFPMKADLRGAARKKIIITSDTKKGTKMKITRRGNLVAADIAQLNLKATKYGEKPLDQIIIRAVKEKKKSVKEQAVQESLDNVNKITAEDAKNIKPKKKK